MSHDSAALLETPSAGAPARVPQRWAAYLELTKPRLGALVLVTTLVGFVLSGGGPVEGRRLLWTLLGTALTVGAANALNQWMERGLDARMRRTCRRPLPGGRLRPWQALAWGAGLGVAGPLLLFRMVNPLTAALGVAAEVIYLLIYTPLKTRSSLCTLAGAVCGALPPVMGWTAATGRLQAGAWILGAVLFVWQIPHFLALAWVYRADYARGGFRMLPATDTEGQTTVQVIVLYSLALLPVGLAATFAGIAGWVYAAGSLALGLAFVTLGVAMYRQRTEVQARRLFLASIVYLPLLLGLMVADRGPALGPAGATGSDALLAHEPQQVSLQ